MTQPRVELFPLRPAVRTDSPTTLDLLVRITPPELETDTKRPTLNLGLVIDRSGSMSALKKIDYAREAAAFAVRELAATDRVSLTIFDDKVETLAPNSLAEDKPRLLTLIGHVQPGGSTALHGGWAEGARQVGDNLVAGGLNRVVLLSDGLANVGESRPDAIATDVHTRLGTGVSTTTLGLGNDYNEDLMEAMARAGDGNYYYVESPAQLATIFQAEMLGLTATAGTDVTLAVEPGPGVVGAELLNDTDKTPDGRYKMPNLVAGFPVLAVVRLTVPPASGERRVCAVTVAWTPPGAVGRSSATVGLTLPAVTPDVWATLAPDLEVQERAVLLAVARLKKQATLELDRRNPDHARRLLTEARTLLATVPQTAEVGAEVQSIAEIDAMIERGEYAASAKRGKFEAHNRRYSKPLSSLPPPPPPGPAT